MPADTACSRSDRRRRMRRRQKGKEAGQEHHLHCKVAASPYIFYFHCLCRQRCQFGKTASWHVNRLKAWLTKNQRKNCRNCFRNLLLMSGPASSRQLETPFSAGHAPRHKNVLDLDARNRIGHIKARSTTKMPSHRSALSAVCSAPQSLKARLRFGSPMRRGRAVGAIWIFIISKIAGHWARRWVALTWQTCWLLGTHLHPVVVEEAMNHQGQRCHHTYKQNPSGMATYMRRRFPTTGHQAGRRWVASLCRANQWDRSPADDKRDASCAPMAAASLAHKQE